MPLLIQIVHLDQSNSNSVVYTAYDGGVVARLQVCNDRRLARHSRHMATVLNIADLTASDDSTEYRRLPVIVGSNHCSSAVVQFQHRIRQCIGDPILRELRTNRTNDHPLWPSALNNKTANHHVRAGLNKAAGTDVTKTRT